MQRTEQSKHASGSAWSAPHALTVRSKPVRPWLVLVSLVFGFFMALLDGSIVNIAIPTIQASLKADLSSVSWVLSAYNLIFAVLLVTGGRFADQFGRKRIFMLGMILFSLGSLFCALAETLGAFSGYPAINWLIGSRAFQAIGAALLTPISLAIIMNVFPQEKRGAAIGVWGALTGLAAAFGPVLGGFLLQNFDWRWIFFVNLPFCLIGLVMVSLFVPETRDPGVSKRVDLLGTITLSVAIFCLVLAIIEGPDWGWNSMPILSLFAASLLSLLLFVVVELMQKEAIIDFSLFKAASFTGANLTMFLFGIAIQGAFLILVLYFINALGYSQLDAAYAILPIPLASFVVAAVAGRLSTKINPHIMGISGLVLLVIGFVLLYIVGTDAPYLDLAWRSALIGIGMGMIFQSQPNISLSEVPRSKLGVGSGIFNTFRQVGFTLGVAVLISVFTGQLQTNLAQARTDSIAIVQADTKIPAQLRAGIISGLNSSTSNSSTGKSVDLSPLADRLPPQVPAQTRKSVRSELQTLSTGIARTFKTQVINSYKATWLVAALFAAAGLISAICAFVARRPVSQQAQMAPQTPEEVHASIG